MSELLTPDEQAGDVPIVFPVDKSAADRSFRALLFCSSLILLAVIAAVTLKLVFDARSALFYSGLHFLTSDIWDPTLHHPSYGILGDLAGSLVIAMVALAIALPVSVATALMINEYSPRRVRRFLVGLVDLLAAVPGLIFGLWGLRYFSGHVFGTTKWLSHHANFIPIFRSPEATYGNSLFICGLVVSVMVVPVITSVCREVMSQVPREQCEAALALGGTRWAMITEVILPSARKGIVGGALLGLGRALGETIAVVLILGGGNTLWLHILSPGGGTIPALIVNQFAAVPQQGESALDLAGLTLFATTLVITLTARAIVGRRATSAT